MPFDLARAVVVFDLDDTLYQEADYVESGVRHVCAQIKRLYGRDPYPALIRARLQNPTRDWLSLVCELAGLPSAAKESLLWMYRLHQPNIRLSQSCSLALQQIRSAASAVAVLTDGRSVTQRLKLNALGLADWPVYISEDYGKPKPAPDRFKAIEMQYPAKNYFYVADNVQKDFLGCNPLGWIGIGMRGNQRNVHSQSTQSHPASSLPAYWVNNWEELTTLFFTNFPPLVPHHQQRG